MPSGSDAALIAAAMQATGLSARALARVLAVDEVTVRRWLIPPPHGRPLKGPARQLLRVLVEWPEAALLLGDD